MLEHTLHSRARAQPRSPKARGRAVFRDGDEGSQWRLRGERGRGSVDSGLWRERAEETAWEVGHSA